MTRPGASPAAVRAQAAPQHGTRSATGALAGVGELARLAFRRDRVMLVGWVYVLLAISVSAGYAVKIVYKTAASRAAIAATVRTDPALAFLYGQLHGVSPGVVAAWRYLAYAALFAGLMSIFLVVRHTRADEETGRLELIGSTVVGRHAPLVVALLVAGVANVVSVVLTTVVLASAGLPLAGSAAFGLAEASCGLVFAGIAAVAAQISGTARGARGLAITVLGVSFLLRGIGDSGGSHGLNWMTWLSPVGWAELIRPFGGERWWILALPAAAVAAGTAAAFWLAGGRDQGAGLIQPRPGPAAAGRLLEGPGGLAWRLQRSSVAGWAAGFVAGGLAIGVVGNGIGKLIGSGAGVHRVISRVGGQAGLTSAYLAACMSLIGLVAAAYAVSAVLRLRSEETEQRVEPLLAGPVSRLRWGSSHLLVALAGTIVVLLAGGLGVGFGFGAATSDLSTQVPRLLGAALAQVPASVAVAAVAAVLVGLLPQASVAGGWTAMALAGFIGLFGPALNLPQAVLDIYRLDRVGLA